MSSTSTLAVSADPAVGLAPTHAWTAEIGSVRGTFGAGVLARVGELARELDCRRVLVVTDPGLRAAGYPAYAAQALIAAGCEVRIFDDVGENPYQTAYWSYVNLVFHRSLPVGVPAWYSRGLTEVLSNTIVRDTLGIIVGSVIAHVLMSPLLIFGWGPMPALGPAGAG